MKFPASALLFTLWANALFSQTFHPLPGSVLEQEVAFEQANECYLYFDNPSGDTLQLRWRRFEISVPQGWVVDLCDYGLCYVGIPASGTMNPVFDTIQPYLKLIVQPGTTPGSAWLRFRVFEKDNDSNFADVYFSLFTPGTTGTVAPAEKTLRISPNPSTDFLWVENKDIASQTARLLDVAGHVVWEQLLAPESQTRVDVRTSPAGLYFLQTTHTTYKVLVQK